MPMNFLYELYKFWGVMVAVVSLTSLCKVLKHSHQYCHHLFDTPSREFPGCPVVRTQCFTAGAWIQSWSWYWDPTSHMAEKTNKQQNLPVYFLKVYLLKIVWNDVIRNKIWITDTQEVIVPYLKITFIFWQEHINRIFDIHYIRWLLLFLLI